MAVRPDDLTRPSRRPTRIRKSRLALPPLACDSHFHVSGRTALSLCAGPGLHADRRLQGRFVPAARIPGLPARRVRAIDGARQRQWGRSTCSTPARAAIAASRCSSRRPRTLTLSGSTMPACAACGCICIFRISARRCRATTCANHREGIAVWLACRHSRRRLRPH